MALARGSIINGKYRLLRPVGEGAMGMVWAAVNQGTDREVALKLIPGQHAASGELRARMLTEARACGRIVHRNVVEIYDVGETEEGDPFLVMPLLSGETLAATLAHEGRMPAHDACEIALEIAKGLGAAHTAGIVHRDLKPGNIFLVYDPEESLSKRNVKILDFGVSKILESQDSTSSMTGMPLGSPAYMSPEQAKGQRQLDHRTDLWSLGVVLFEMIAGSRPFDGDNPFAVVGQILGERIPRLSERAAGVDPRLDELVARCIERDARRRIGAASDFVATMRGILGGPVTDPRVAGPASARGSTPRGLEGPPLQSLVDDDPDDREQTDATGRDAWREPSTWKRGQSTSDRSAPAPRDFSAEPTTVQKPRASAHDVPDPPTPLGPPRAPAASQPRGLPRPGAVLPSVMVDRHDARPPASAPRAPVASQPHGLPRPEIERPRMPATALEGVVDAFDPARAVRPPMRSDPGGAAPRMPATSLEGVVGAFDPTRPRGTSVTSTTPMMRSASASPDDIAGASSLAAAGGRAVPVRFIAIGALAAAMAVVGVGLLAKSLTTSSSVARSTELTRASSDPTQLPPLTPATATATTLSAATAPAPEVPSTTPAAPASSGVAPEALPSASRTGVARTGVGRQQAPASTARPAAPKPPASATAKTPDPPPPKAPDPPPQPTTPKKVTLPTDPG